MGRKPKFSKEVKIRACRDYEEGNISFSKISKQIGANEETVRRWYLTYKEHGPSILKHQIEIAHIVRDLSCQWWKNIFQVNIHWQTYPPNIILILKLSAVGLINGIMVWK